MAPCPEKVGIDGSFSLGGCGRAAIPFGYGRQGLELAPQEDSSGDGSL